MVLPENESYAGQGDHTSNVLLNILEEEMYFSKTKYFFLVLYSTCVKLTVTLKNVKENPKSRQEHPKEEK